jgi:hypothetical protein
MTRVHLPRSTTKVLIRSPLFVLPLIGGGSEIVWCVKWGPPLPPVLHLKVHDVIDAVDLRKI